MSYNCLPHYNPRCIMNWRRQLETEEMSRNPQIQYHNFALWNTHKEKQKRYASLVPSTEKKEGLCKQSVGRMTYIPTNPPENEFEILGCSTTPFRSLINLKKAKWGSNLPQRPTSSFLSCGHNYEKNSDFPGPGLYYPHPYEESTNSTRHVRNFDKMSKRPELFDSATYSSLNFFEAKSFVDMLSNKADAHRGRFLASERFSSKPGERIYWESPRTLPPDVKNQVAPTSYETKPLFKRIVVRGRKRAPFLSSAPRIPCDNLLGPVNYTGPGRYVIQSASNAPHIPAASHIFNSKSSRHMSFPEAAHWGSRIQPRGVPKFPSVKKIHIA